jgi:hypothetical protein
MTTVVGIVIGYFLTIAEATQIVSVTSLPLERLDKIVSVTLLLLIRHKKTVPDTTLLLLMITNRRAVLVMIL